jgi:hypothetical protein
MTGLLERLATAPPDRWMSRGFLTLKNPANDWMTLGMIESECLSPPAGRIHRSHDGYPVGLASRHPLDDHGLVNRSRIRSIPASPARIASGR